MRTIPIFAAVMLFVSSAAWADNKNVTGNFRRREAIEKAGLESKNAFVHGRTGVAQPEGAKVLFVQDKTTNKITIIKAPLDKKQAVSVMSTEEANSLKIRTQDQAQALAERNGGVYGLPGKVPLAPMKISSSGMSYKFNQLSGKPVAQTTTVRSDGSTEIATTRVERTVPMTIGPNNRGESALSDTRYKYIRPAK